MTTWLRVRDIARLTNLSRRYWQRRFARGEVPGAWQIELGHRRLFIAERKLFEPWWAGQLREITIVNLQLSQAGDPEPSAEAKASCLSQVSQTRGGRRRRAGRTVDPRQRDFGFQQTSRSADIDRHDP